MNSKRDLELLKLQQGELMVTIAIENMSPDGITMTTLAKEARMKRVARYLERRLQRPHT